MKLKGNIDKMVLNETVAAVKATTEKTIEEKRECCVANAKSTVKFDKRRNAVVAQLKYANEFLRRNDNPTFVLFREIEENDFEENKAEVWDKFKSHVLNGEYDSEIQYIADKMSKARLAKEAA